MSSIERSNEEKLWYVSLNSGCGIRAGTKREVMRQMAREIGTDNVREIRRATASDVSWVRGMGGYVPKGRVSE